MIRFLRKGIIVSFLLLTAGMSAFAQSGAYSGYTPYSIFGIGDISDPGTAYNATMGGVGIASRNTRYINILNPAAVTARDSLAFMADFSLYQNNKIISQGNKLSANNLFNLRDIVISFPIYRSSAMMLGITPYSTSGYSYSMYLDPTDPELARIISKMGDITSTAEGQGSIYKIFASAGVTFWKKLSLGVEGSYYFGNIEKNYYPRTFASAGMSSVESTYDIVLKGASAKVGVQYEGEIGNLNVGLGATYQLESKINGFITDARYSSGASIDTIRYKVDTLGVTTAPLKFASELGVGVSIRYDQRFRAEFDYTYSDWSRSGMAGINGMAVSSDAFTFGTAKAQAFRAGFEYIPNPNDVRYYHRRWAYRAGVYHKKSYFAMDGNQLITTGITIGVTLPVYTMSNGLTFGLEVGRSGMNIENSIKETFVNFSIGINTYDLWFRKSSYN